MANKAPMPSPSKLNAKAVNSKIIHETFECCRGGVCPVHGGLSTSPSRSLLAKGPTDSWTSIKNMPKDIAQYAIDQAVTTDLKKDDIQRHSVDEKLDLWGRAQVCLKSPESMERVYVAAKLDVFLKENANRAFQEIIPNFIEELKKQSVNFHNAAATSLVGAVKDLYGRNAVQAKALLQLIFQYIDAEDKAISQGWTSTMLDLMDVLSPSELEKEFAPAIISKAKNAGSVNGRKAACILIKKMLSKVSSDFGIKQLIPLVVILCRDAKPEVKGTMCLQLSLICQYFKPKENILQYLSLLASDSDAFVKTSLISTIRKVFMMPDMKTTFMEILPLMKTIVKDAYVTSNLPLLQEFSLDMADIAKTLSDAGMLSPENKLWFLDAFLQMCRYGLTPQERTGGPDLPPGFLNFRAQLDFSRRRSLAESLISNGGIPKSNNKVTNDLISQQAWICRANAAKGFANFVRFAKPLVDFNAGLKPLIVDLMHDPVPAVRAGMAGNLYPIMQILETSGHVLCGEFVYALADDEMSVIEAIVPNVGDILKVLAAGKVISPESMTQGLVEVGGALIFCEERLQGTVNWRMHAKLLDQLSVLPQVFPGDYIYSNIVPNLFHRLLHLRQMPARLAAAETIVTFLRQARRANQREAIRERIKESFGNGRGFQDRMLYLFMSKMIMDNFSRKYFREYFFEETLNMAEDPVANVRMKLCGVLPTMQGTLKNADDDRLLRKLEEVVKRIRESENDRDVQNALNEAVEDMKKLAEKAQAREKKKPGQRTKEDFEDEAKEKEEAFIESLEPPPAANAAQVKNKVFYKPQAQPPKRVSAGPPPPLPMPTLAKPQPATQGPPNKPVPVPARPGAPAPVAVVAPTPQKLIELRPQPKTVGVKATRHDFGSGTRIVEKTGPEVPQENKENPFLAEANRLRRKTLVPMTVAHHPAPGGAGPSPKK